MKTFKTTLLGGVLFLVPLVMLIFIIAKAYEFSQAVALPLGKLVPLERIAGIPLHTIIGICLILAICYVAGLIARGKLLGKSVTKVDRVFTEVVPGYAVVKSMLGGFVGETADDTALQPVLIRLDDFDQLAFEVEKLDGRSIVFLPGAPSAWSGSSVIVEADRITRLALPPHQVTGVLRVLGRGAGKLNLPAPHGR